MHQNNVCFAIIGTLKKLDLDLNRMSAYVLKNIAIVNVKGVQIRCILWGISRNEAVNRLNNSVLEDKGVL